VSGLDIGHKLIEELIEATHPLPSMPDESFSYDQVGNRLLKQGQTNVATFDDACYYINSKYPRSLLHSKSFQSIINRV